MKAIKKNQKSQSKILEMKTTIQQIKDTIERLNNRMREAEKEFKN